MEKNRITPGVYIEEKDAFPNLIVGVGTAVPAFIGFTEKAMNQQRDLTHIPTRISSMSEYQTYFGAAPPVIFKLEATENATTPYQIRYQSKRFLLYHCLQHFYVNGGKDCYIVSIGNYNKASIKPSDFYNDDVNQPKGIDTLLKETEPTLLLAPDAMLLNLEESAIIHRKMLAHCQQMASRFAILDVYMDRSNGKDEQVPNTQRVVSAFRDAIGNEALQWGAAYYPWLRTTIVQEQSVNYTFLASDSLPVLIHLLQTDALTTQLSAELNAPIPQMTTLQDEDTISQNHKILLAISPLYKSIIHALQEKLNLLPPSGAIAGIYSMTDNMRGVFKAPANVSLSSVTQPFVNINDADQEFLNVPPDGKAVNAIRSFPGKGVLVWGARTLDGNNNEYRYVSVRRTIIFLEQSIKYGIQAYVFEPNTAVTWTTIQATITNFLTNCWKLGGLMGTTPDNAFFVKIGLGSTMTQQDMLDGVLRVTVGVAIVRPAEFIIINFQQKMQPS